MEDLVAIYVGCGGKFTDASKFKHHNIFPIIYVYNIIYIYIYIYIYIHISYLTHTYHICS